VVVQHYGPFLGLGQDVLGPDRLVTEGDTPRPLGAGE